jgi:hypothetical protein
LSTRIVEFRTGSKAGFDLAGIHVVASTAEIGATLTRIIGNSRKLI